MSATPHAAGGVLPYVKPQEVAAQASVACSQTLRQYRLTLIWTFAAIAFCGLCYAIEKYLVRDTLGVTALQDSLYRMFKNPAELPMRIFGIPHILIATLFLLSSRRVRGIGSYASLGGLLAAGIGLCVLFSMFGWDGNSPNPIALLIFYFYFLIHGFRDEAFFYRAFGEMPKDGRPVHDRIMIVLQLLSLGLLMSLGVPAYILYGQIRPEFRHPALDALFPADWHYLTRIAACFVPMVVIAIGALWAISRSFPDGLAGLWRTHRPILTVYLVSIGIILLALGSGPWTFNAVVLMHFVGWYLFGRWMFAQRPPKVAPRPWSWNWMRGTRTGFTVLHLGLAGVVVVLIAISCYAFGKSDWIEVVLGSRAFYYWTILHVTLSFYPR